MEKRKLYYCWVIVGALFLVAALPMVFISTFYSYYQVPICSEFGCSYAQFNISNIASTVAGILFSLAFASKVGAGNTRLFMLLGGIVAAVGLKLGCAVTCIIACIALVCLILVPRFGATAAYASVIIIPFGAGITSLAPPLLTGSLFGYKDYSGIYGLGNAFFMVGCMIGPMLSSGLRDSLGSYIPAWIAMIAAYLILAFTAALSTISAKKLRK